MPGAGEGAATATADGCATPGEPACADCGVSAVFAHHSPAPGFDAFFAGSMEGSCPRGRGRRLSILRRRFFLLQLSFERLDALFHQLKLFEEVGVGPRRDRRSLVASLIDRLIFSKRQPVACIEHRERYQRPYHHHASFCRKSAVSKGRCVVNVHYLHKVV